MNLKENDNNKRIDFSKVSRAFILWLKQQSEEYAKEHILQCLTDGRNSPDCPNEVWLLWEAVLGKDYKCLPSKLDSALYTLVSAVKQDTTIK